MNKDIAHFTKKLKSKVENMPLDDKVDYLQKIADRFEKSTLIGAPVIGAIYGVLAGAYFERSNYNHIKGSIYSDKRKDLKSKLDFAKFFEDCKKERGRPISLSERMRREKEERREKLDSGYGGLSRYNLATAPGRVKESIEDMFGKYPFVKEEEKKDIKRAFEASFFSGMLDRLMTLGPHRTRPFGRFYVYDTGTGGAGFAA